MKSLKYEGNGFFRQRIVLSLLSGRPVEIHKIKLTELHGNLFRLLEKITSGSILKITKNGTLLFKPGTLVGGKYITHDCSLSRGIGYFLEPLLILSLFSKNPTSITLRGITNCSNDLSVDMYRNSTFKIVNFFSPKNENFAEPTIQIVKRGAAPKGGGEIRFFCKNFTRPINSIIAVNEGVIKRIRGVCYSTNISSSICNRVVFSSKGFLLKYLQNVYLSTDHYSGKGSGLSSGYAFYLEAELGNTKNENKYKLSVEYSAKKGSIPEDVGIHTSKLLSEEIKNGGCFDITNQWLVFVLMALSKNNVSRVKMGGKLSPYAIEYLRHIKDFLGVKFDIKPIKRDKDKKVVDDRILCTCIGSNYKNLHWKSS